MCLSSFTACCPSRRQTLEAHDHGSIDRCEHGPIRHARFVAICSSLLGLLTSLEQFIIDTFTRIEPDGAERPTERPDEIGGGGTYTVLGARMFLPPSRLGMIVDYTPGTMPPAMRSRLAQYGPEMYCFRLRDDGDPTARAVNRYKGEERG